MAHRISNAVGPARKALVARERAAVMRDVLPAPFPTVVLIELPGVHVKPRKSSPCIEQGSDRPRAAHPLLGLTIYPRSGTWGRSGWAWPRREPRSCVYTHVNSAPIRKI